MVCSGVTLDFTIIILLEVELNSITGKTCITDEDSKPEILSRIAQTTAALTRLKPIWNDRSISFSSKIRPMHSLVTSIFLYACE